MQRKFAPLLVPLLLFILLSYFRSFAGMPASNHYQPTVIQKRTSISDVMNHVQKTMRPHSIAQEKNENATLQGQWAKGPTFAVTATKDGHVYFGDGAQLVCATINTSGEISEQGRLTLPGTLNDIEISADGNYAYVAVGYPGVAVVDIQSSSDPQLINVVTKENNPFDAKAVSLTDNRLFIAATIDGVIAADVFRPDSIILRGDYVTPLCGITDVVAYNDTVFVANGSHGLQMLRYINNRFELLNQVNYNKYTEDYQSQTPMPNGLFKQHDSLFVADSWTGLFFFTVQDTVLTLSGYTLGGCQYVAAQGTHVYTTDYTNLNLFYDGGGIPTYRDAKPVSTSKRLAVWNNWVIVAAKSHGVYTFEDHNAINLSEGEFFATSSLTYAVFRQGYYLYRTTPVNTLDVISVHNPADPHTAGHLDLGGENLEAEKVYVQGDTAIVYSHDFSNGDNIFYFIDVSDPSNPKVLTSWTHPLSGSFANKIIFRNKLLFISLSPDLSIVDFADLNAIHESGRVTTSGWITDMDIKDNYVYTASYDLGMDIIDVSDPTNPQEKTTFRESDQDYYSKIIIRDNYAYIGDEGIGLKILDLSSPLAPVVVGSFTEADGDFYADDLALSGNYAYLTRNEGEVIFLNVSDPGDIQLKGVYNNYNLSSILAYSRMLYVPTLNTGIYLVSNDNPDALADCHVAGEVSGEWTCPTIYLEDDITIPAGDTLRITDSVKKVFALGPYRIKVEGVLIAKGPANDRVDLSGDRILFSGNGWHGIYFNNLNDGNSGTSIIENCRFDYADKLDISYQGGGAVAIYNSDNVIIRKSVFYRNNACLGGAIYIENSSPKIEDCYFEINGRGGVNLSEANAEGGGAMYIKNANPYLHRLRFTKNGAQSGGAMVIDGCSPALSNILFDQNFSTGLAGAVAITSDLSHPAHPRFVNVTAADNEAPNGGGAFQLMGPDTRPEIINSILLRNSKPEIYINDGVPTVTYSIVDSAGTENWFGTGCLTDDPTFDESGEINYHLKSASCGNGLNSPAIDAGHPDSVDTFLDCSAGLGTARADMGYYGGRYAELSTGMESSGLHVVPQQFTLSQNYPNPFNPTTSIRYQVAKQGNVQLIVYNMLGQKVATLVDQKQAPGRYTVAFDASGLASGVYFYRLTTGNRSLVKKMILMR